MAQSTTPGAGPSSLQSTTPAAPGASEVRHKVRANHSEGVAEGAVIETNPLYGVLLLLLLLCCMLMYVLGCCEGKRRSGKSGLSKRRAAPAQRPESIEDSVASGSFSSLAGPSELEMQRVPLVHDKGEALSPTGPSPAKGPDLFDVIDRNRDGVISPSEFAQAMGVTGPALPGGATLPAAASTGSAGIAGAVPAYQQPRVSTIRGPVTGTFGSVPVGTAFTAPTGTASIAAPMAAAPVPHAALQTSAPPQAQGYAMVPGTAMTGQVMQPAFDLVTVTPQGLSVQPFSGVGPPPGVQAVQGDR
uniref:EF-hand domain-containing protein n=1 Tax=Pyrodinium bahamense TaxID=73915 RepID=A0A7S0FUA1_9DINO